MTHPFYIALSSCLRVLPRVVFAPSIEWEARHPQRLMLHVADDQLSV